MKRWITALGAVLAMAGSGCDQGIILDPIRSLSSGGGGGSSSSQGDGGGASVQNLSMRFGDWTIPHSTPPGLFDVSLNVQEDPEALVLFFSDAPQACGQPVISRSTDLSSCDPSDAFLQIILVIPPELNRPGLIDLTDPRIAAHEMRWQPTCGGGSGDTPGLRGTLEIVSSDASSVSVKLRAGAHQADWPSLDGDYTVQRCGAAPVVPAPSPAIAIQGASLPAPPEGPAPDPSMLYLLAASAAETCADPWASVHCTGGHRFVIGIPPALQKPGIIDLNDPTITAIYADSQDNPAACTQNDYVTGPFPRGTVEILSIDASSVAFRIYGSNLTPNVWLDVDGLYSAAICP